MSVKVKVKKLVPGAVLPKKAHASDAGFDLVAVSQKFEKRQYVYGFGLAFEIPEGYVGLVFPRSSVYKKDLIMSNCVGVVDSGYRGEVTARFNMAGRPDDAEGFPMYQVGERVAQLVIMKLPDVDLEEAEELGDSERGTGGYGSTGV